MEILVLVVSVAALGIASNFFGADSREFSTVRETQIDRWSR